MARPLLYTMLECGKLALYSSCGAALKAQLTVAVDFLIARTLWLMRILKRILLIHAVFAEAHVEVLVVS